MRAAGRPWQDRAGERWGRGRPGQDATSGNTSSHCAGAAASLESACEGAPVESRMRTCPNPEEQ